MILPPSNAQLIRGEIADYWFSPEGILYSYSKSTTRTVETISRNIELVKNVTGGKPVPLLIYLAKSPVPDKETRKFSAEKLPDIYKAMAMVSKGGLGQFIMNLLFKFKPPAIPMKTFADDAEAKAWLKQFI